MQVWVSLDQLNSKLVYLALKSRLFQLNVRHLFRVIPTRAARIFQLSPKITLIIQFFMVKELKA